MGVVFPCIMNATLSIERCTHRTARDEMHMSPACDRLTAKVGSRTHALHSPSSASNLARACHLFLRDERVWTEKQDQKPPSLSHQSLALHWLTAMASVSGLALPIGEDIATYSFETCIRRRIRSYRSERSTYGLITPGALLPGLTFRNKHCASRRGYSYRPVSYTHLTLPTIYSV